MNTEEVAAKFDDRPGFRLVDFGDVGLPIYKLTATGLLLAKKNLSPIEEFVLRSVHIGFTNVEEISSLLGLGTITVEAALASLIRSEDIFEYPNSSVKLTSKGQRTFLSESSVYPREQTIVFYYNGLTREPTWFGGQDLFTPKQADAAGLRQIRSFPARKPRVDELEVNDVFSTLRKAVKASEDHYQLLRIKQIRFAHQLFLHAVMLVYKSSISNDVQVGFAIDGRRSEKHEVAFLKADGPVKLGIEDAVKRTDVVKEQKEALTGARGRKILATTRESEGKSEELHKKMASAKFVVEIAEERLESASNSDEKEKAENELIKVKSRVRKYVSDLKKLPVRPVPVYEHPKLLESAVVNARNRLLIISPWITPGVMNPKMMKSLSDLLTRGVNVYLGYGISAEITDRDDNIAVNELQSLAKQFTNFHFVRMGDTHAKVLIKDSDFYVITSFNWLSFKGDPKRTFREEWGTYVGISDHVDEYFNELLHRFRG